MTVGRGSTSFSSVSGDWTFWLVGGFALLLRAVLAIAYMAGRGWHGHLAFIPGSGIPNLLLPCLPGL
jgi:hypothetical protein